MKASDSYAYCSSVVVTVLISSSFKKKKPSTCSLPASSYSSNTSTSNIEHAQIHCYYQINLIKLYNGLKKVVPVTFLTARVNKGYYPGGFKETNRTRSQIRQWYHRSGTLNLGADDEGRLRITTFMVMLLSAYMQVEKAIQVLSLLWNAEEL